MPSVPNLTHPTLHGKITLASGAPATGRVLVEVAEPTQDPTGDTVIGTQVDELVLEDGEFSTPVPALATAPGPTLVLTILLDDTRPDGYVFTVQAAAGTVELADVPDMRPLYLRWNVERPA